LVLSLPATFPVFNEQSCSLSHSYVIHYFLLHVSEIIWYFSSSTCLSAAMILSFSYIDIIKMEGCQSFWTKWISLFKITYFLVYLHTGRNKVVCE
jgi:hypothetical protein